MSDDLVARLRHAWDERERQLDEDERVARAAYAESPDWSIQPGHRRPRILWLDVMDSTDPATMPLVLAEHMARFAPARVLAEVKRQRRDIAAKRRILDEIMGYEAKIDGEWGCLHSADQIEAGECPDTRPDEIAGVRLLAEAEGLA